MWLHILLKRKQGSMFIMVLFVLLAGACLSAWWWLQQPGSPIVSALPQVTNQFGMTFGRISSGPYQIGSREAEEGRERDEKLHLVRIEGN